MLSVRVLCLLFLVFLLVVPRVSSIPVQAAGSRKFALVIGVGRGYRNVAFRTLTYPEQDARQMAAALQKLGFAVVALTGEPATKEAIAGAFEDLGAKANHPDDVVVVYFSGHGAIQRSADREMPSLVPANADPRRRITFISDLELGQWLGYSKSRKIMLVLDACYSAGIGAGGEKRLTTPEQMTGQDVQARLRRIKEANFVGALFQSTVILASSQARETSKETDEGGITGGVFTYYLLQGLGEESQHSCPACEEGTNTVTPQTWLEYARKGVAASVDQEPNLQTPENGGEVALLIPWIKPAPGATVRPLPSAVPSRRATARPTRAPTRPPPQPVAVHSPRPTMRHSPLPAARIPAGVPAEYFQFARIPAGDFMMGSPTDEPERDNDEAQHRVTISRAFEMQTTLVTQALWQAVMGTNPSNFKGADLPVERVSWGEAQVFIRKLNQMLATSVYRLPTEAEWEYAARAGTTTPFWTGDDLTTDQANYNGNYPYNGNAKGQFREKTTPVKMFPPNPWGLYDVHGNVWEWVQDRYGPYPSGSGTDPTGPGTGAARVFRGGTWGGNARYGRSANRYGFVPGARDNGLGLRLARSIDR